MHDLLVLSEMERRARFWSAAGCVVGGLLAMWIYRTREAVDV